MRKKVLRIAALLVIVGAAAPVSTAYADSCPPLTLTNGEIACHLTGGDCSAADYNCEGAPVTWNVCGLC